MILLDADTNDETEQILATWYHPAIAVKKFHYKAGFDDREKIEQVNIARHDLNFDWFIGVDSDEFIFHPKGPVKVALKNANGDVCFTRFYQMYRHATEADIDHGQAPRHQRQYGDPDICTGWKQRWKKPNVVRTGIYWSAGHHEITSGPIARSQIEFKGAHWRMADVEHAVARRLALKSRSSKKAVQDKVGYHNHNITEKKIRAECKKWLNKGQKLL